MKLVFTALFVYAFLFLLMTHQWFGPVISLNVVNARFHIFIITAGIISAVFPFFFFRGILREEVSKEIKKLEEIVQDDNPTEVSEESNEQSGLHSA